LLDAARRVQDGSDREAIHDVRVAIRRLVATLKLWGSDDPDAADGVVVRSFRRLRRRLGEVRELEVQVGWLEPRVCDHGSEAAEILARMQKRLLRSLDRAKQRLRGRRLKRLGKLLKLLAAEFDLTAADEAMVLVRAQQRVAKLGRAAHDALANARATSSAEELHEARLRIKKWRYAIESLRDIEPTTPLPELGPLREIQEVLGDIHDRWTLREVLAEMTASVPADSLQGLVTELEREERNARAALPGLVSAFKPIKPSAHGTIREAGLSSESGEHPTEDSGERWDRMASWLARIGKDSRKPEL
jgi:CHAD domain-containing protein